MVRGHDRRSKPLRQFRLHDLVCRLGERLDNVVAHVHHVCDFRFEFAAPRCEFADARLRRLDLADHHLVLGHEGDVLLSYVANLFGCFLERVLDFFEFFGSGFDVALVLVRRGELLVLLLLDLLLVLDFVGSEALDVESDLLFALGESGLEGSAEAVDCWGVLGLFAELADDVCDGLFGESVERH